MIAVGAGAMVLASSALSAMLPDGAAQEAQPESEPEPEPSSEPEPEREPAADSTLPMPLHIGLYPLHIGELDLHTGTAEVTYYVWTRWSGASDGTTYELVNGTLDAREHEYRYEENGERYAYYRCRAHVHVELDFHAFPFDEHELRIEMEHSDDGDETVVFVVDEASVRHVMAPSISGWDVGAPRYDVVRTEYRTNWGMPGVGPDEWMHSSRFRMSLPIHHAVGATFLKTFLTLFISVLITFLGFFMHPEELEARVGVGVAGVFGAVTSQAVVAGNLPDIPYMTLSDKIHLAGLVFVFIALFETVTAGALVRSDRVQSARRMDRWARGVVIPGFAAVVATLVLTR